MSNREALRKLSRKFPPPPEIARTLEALDHEPDRSAAIVGAGLLETALERLIIKSLKNSTPQLIGELFENRGPLSDFRSKIIAACAFGIINPIQAEHLHTIRFIRNAFAHSRINVTFDTPEIAKELDSSILIQIINKHFQKAKLAGVEVKTIPAKIRFLLVIRLLFTFLDHRQRDLGGPPLEDNPARTTQKASS